jgi:ribose-phosphate pyrophosphokinase
MKNYEKKKHPDGQITVKVSDKVTTIVERINSYEDLFYIKSIVDANRSNVDKLIIPCLFGQRGDRRFNENESFDLKLITDFINSCNFKEVYIFDPHSDVSMALINNSKKVTSFNYILDILPSIYSENLILVSPDSGSYKKLFDYSTNLKLPLVAANKFRDKENKITLNFLGDVKGKECFIIDDLCSRGGTFIKLAQELKRQGAIKVYLYISHFEGGCEEYKETINNLLVDIDKVYTTNSFRDFDDDDLKKINVLKLKPIIKPIY